MTPADPSPGLVIFDCDGVLVDSEPTSTGVLATALSAAGVPTSSAEALHEYKGMLVVDIIARAERRLGARLPAGFSDTFERDRVRAFHRSLEAVPGAEATVRSVKAAGVGVCVASQGKLEKTELTLRLTGLRDLFGEHALFSAYTVKRGKPHPDLFLHAAEAMGFEPDECVVVEDTVIGVSAAISAGMRAFAYGAGDDAYGDDAARLREAGAETLRSLTELPALIGLRLTGSGDDTRRSSAGSI